MPRSAQAERARLAVQEARRLHAAEVRGLQESRDEAERRRALAERRAAAAEEAQARAEEEAAAAVMRGRRPAAPPPPPAASAAVEEEEALGAAQAEMQRLREELKRSQEDQLGAALRARRLARAARATGAAA